MTTDGPIHHKFDVRRVDGNDGPGSKHDGCDYFVLDLSHDVFAADAMRAYAEAAHATHPTLAAAVRQRVIEMPDHLRFRPRPRLGAWHDDTDV